MVAVVIVLIAWTKPGSDNWRFCVRKARNSRLRNTLYVPCMYEIFNCSQREHQTTSASNLQGFPWCTNPERDIIGDNNEGYDKDIILKLLHNPDNSQLLAVSGVIASLSELEHT